MRPAAASAPPPLKADAVLQRRFPMPVLLAGGVVVTFLVFAFLAWLQPVLSSGERLRLDSTLAFRVQARPAKPPPKPKKEPPTQREQSRPQERPRQRQRTLKQTQRRADQSRAFEAPKIAAAAPSGLGLAAGIGGGSGVMNNFSSAMQQDLGKIEEYREYEERRGRARERGFQRDRGRAGLGGSNVSRPKLTNQRKPRYPAEAKQLQLEGRVVIDVLISVDGKVIDSKIVSAQPEGYFEDAILDVLPLWEFAPAEDESGRPIEEWEQFIYVFEFEDA